MNKDYRIMHCEKDRAVLFVHDGPVPFCPVAKMIDSRFGHVFASRYVVLGKYLSVVSRLSPSFASSTVGFEPQPENFRLVGIPNVKTLNGRVFEAQKAKKIIRREVARAQLVVVRLPSLSGSWAYREAIRLAKPVMIEFVACTWDSLWHYSFLGKILAPFFLLKNRRILKSSSHVIYVTEKFLQERYPTEGKCIACSNVVIDATPPAVLEFRLKKISEHTNEDSITLTTIGPVDVLYKDQATVLRALVQLIKVGRRFRYRLIGQGCQKRLKGMAERLGISDQIEFVGPVPHAEIPRWLDETDIYIQPSRQEGLPRALIEAMSRGCPVLGSDAGGIPELLPSTRIFRKGSYRELSNMLMKLTPQDMMVDARENFEKADQYDRHVLEQRRKVFFNEFLSDSQRLLSQALDAGTKK